MPREPIPTWFFALTVVRRSDRDGDRFLVVHEAKHGQHWYLPAGRVEPGESLVAAACRETLEEAGIPIVVEGILRLEHSPSPEGTARVRVFFLARPEDDRPPKSLPDDESLEARWVTVEELSQLSLRGGEVRRAFEHVRRGGAVAPLSLLVGEGDPWA